MKKLTPRNARQISLGCMLASIPFALLGAAITSPVLGCVTVLLMVVGMVIDLFFYVCPHCGSHLGRDSCAFCKQCGEKIE